MTSTDIESNVLNFFNLFKEVPSVKIVRFDIPELTLATFTSILVENFTKENVSDLLEFRVDTFTAKAYRPEIFEQSVLNEMYIVSKYTCRNIPNIQSYKEAYCFQPIFKPGEEPKLMRTRETRLTINKTITKHF